MTVRVGRLRQQTHRVSERYQRVRWGRHGERVHHTWATVTAAVPETEPAVAVIVVAPFAKAVTSPEASTAATEASLLAHATEAPVIASRSWSRTSAVSRAVSPRAVSAAEPGLTVTVVATGAGGGAGSTAPSPQDSTSMAIAPTAIAEIAKCALSTVHAFGECTYAAASVPNHLLEAFSIACPYLFALPARFAIRFAPVSLGHISQSGRSAIIVSLRMRLP